ncbi:hypothetical protein X975_19786, partial [Stegodyphus mimosarum]
MVWVGSLWLQSSRPLDARIFIILAMRFLIWLLLIVHLTCGNTSCSSLGLLKCRPVVMMYVNSVFPVRGACSVGGWVFTWDGVMCSAIEICAVDACGPSCFAFFALVPFCADSSVYFVSALLLCVAKFLTPIAPFAVKVLGDVMCFPADVGTRGQQYDSEGCWFALPNPFDIVAEIF